MKQRLLQTLLIALLVPTGAWADAVEIDGIYYNLNTDTKEAELKNPRNKTSESIIIPSTVSYDGVTFNVTSIRNNAFSQCEKLKEVVIPNSITSIGEYAFMYCYNLKDCVIPNSVKTLGMRVFYDCRELKSITIPSSVSSIGSNLFYGCDNLSSVKVDSENSVYDSRDNCNAIIETKENKIIAGSNNTVIPSSITSIKGSAFQGCRGLTSIVIGANITSIGGYAFSNCNNIVSVKVDSGNKAYDSRENCNAIINSATNELIAGCMNTVIPSSVTTIGDAAFYGCSGLLSINIPNSITSIGTDGFDKCSSLTSIIIPDGVKILKYRAFNECANLNYVSIGGSVTAIESEAFSGCTSLTEIHSKIKTPFSINKNVFYNRNTEDRFTSATLYVPTDTKALYEVTPGWMEFKNIVEMGDTPEGQQCAKPTISYSKGRLTFASETEGATCHSTITDSDIASYRGNEVELSVTYKISVYAAKAGFENSEIATATLCWIDVNPKTEGIIDGIANVSANAVLIQSNGGQLTIQGVDDGTTVRVYDINGTQAGSAVSNNGSVTISTKLQPDNVAIVKIGEKSVKVLVK